MQDARDLSGATGLMCALNSVWKHGFLCVPILRDETLESQAAFLPPSPAGASLGRDLLVADISVIYLAPVCKPLSQPPVLARWNCLASVSLWWELEGLIEEKQ